MNLAKIKEITSFKKFIHSNECKTEEELINLCISYSEQYLKITYLKGFKTIYIHAKVITFENHTSISIYGPAVTFIDREQLRFTYDLYDVVTVLFSENPIISVLSEEDFINQVNQIKNSYINF